MTPTARRHRRSGPALITVVGAVTMLGGAFRAVLETDLKRVLAYSTISALGVLMLLLRHRHAARRSSRPGLPAGARLLQGCAVSRRRRGRARDGHARRRPLAGLRRAMPLTASAAVLAAASMAGVPLFVGFIAKEQFYDTVRHFAASAGHAGAAFSSSPPSPRACVLGAAGLIAGVSPFRRSRRPTPAHRMRRRRRCGWDPLCSACVGLVVRVLCRRWLDARSLVAASRSPATGDRSPWLLWHGFNCHAAAECRDADRFGGSRSPGAGAIWRPRLAALARTRTALLVRVGRRSTRISRRVAPALQSASLRSYVLTIVVTAVALVEHRRLRPAGVCRRYAAGRRSKLHEGGAGRAHRRRRRSSAAFARSSMAAALSLGTVGYGVAADVRPVRRARSGDDPVRGRDADRRHLRARLLPASGIRRPVVPAGQGVATRSSRRRRGARRHAGAVHRRLRDDLAALCLFRRRGAAAGARAQRRQRHPGRLPRLRYARRDHRPGHRRDRCARAAAASERSDSHDIARSSRRRRVS